MYPNNSANAYKQIEVGTCNRLKLVVMIYDAAIASLKQANASHLRNDLTKRNQYISRTQFIINELNNSLDFQQGSEIASSLRKIYHFLNRHLNSILSDNDIGKLEESLKILSSLQGAWQEISKNTGKEKSNLNLSQNASIYHGRNNSGKSLTYG